MSHRIHVLFLSKSITLKFFTEISLVSGYYHNNNNEKNILKSFYVLYLFCILPNPYQVLPLGHFMFEIEFQFQKYVN